MCFNPNNPRGEVASKRPSERKVFPRKRRWSIELWRDKGQRRSIERRRGWENRREYEEGLANTHGLLRSHMDL